MGSEEGLKDFVENQSKSIDEFVNKVVDQQEKGGMPLGAGVIQGFGLVFKSQIEHDARLIKLENSVNAIKKYTDAVRQYIDLIREPLMSMTELLNAMAKDLDELNKRVEELEGKNDKHD